MLQKSVVKKMHQIIKISDYNEITKTSSVLKFF